MNVSEEEAERLLAEVERTSSEARRVFADAHAAMDAIKRSRIEALNLAMDARIPRKQIAEAAGVEVSRLYQLIE